MKKLNHFILVTCYWLLITGAAHAVINSDSPKTVVADRIEYDANSGALSTSGDTRISNAAGQHVFARDAYISGDLIDAGGTEIDLLLNSRTQITAKSIDKNGDITDTQDVTYTTCYGCDDNTTAWMISAASMVHDGDTHVMDFTNLVFWLYEVPVLWLPKLYYSDPTVKRKSGLLIPTFNTTNHMGLQLNFPLYMTYSDYHDATVTLSYLTNENPLFQVEHRLNMPHSAYRTTGSYTYNLAEVSRWHIINDDTIEMGENARAFLFLARTSDETYLQKYGFYNAQPYLDSGMRAEVYASRGYASAEAHVFQELRSEQNPNMFSTSGNILPNFHGVYQTAPVFANTYASFMGDFVGIVSDNWDSSTERLIAEARVVSPWTILGGQRVELSAAARGDLYNFNNAAVSDGTISGGRARFLPSGYIDWSWAFAKYGDNWTYVITPRARVTGIEKNDRPAFANIDSAGSILSDASLFADNRFSGYDLWGSGSYADYGLFFNAYSNSGITIDAFAGQSYDMQPPLDLSPNSGFHDGASDYVGRVNGYWNDDFSMSNRFRFGRDGFALRHLESIARLGNRNYIEGGYIYATQLDDAYIVSQTTQEVAGGFKLYFTTRWALRGFMTFNIADAHIQRANAALIYDHPCYTAALEYVQDGARRFNIDGDDYIGGSTFKFQFSIKLGEGTT